VQAAGRRGSSARPDLGFPASDRRAESTYVRRTSWRSYQRRRLRRREGEAAGRRGGAGSVSGEVARAPRCTGLTTNDAGLGWLRDGETAAKAGIQLWQWEARVPAAAQDGGVATRARVARVENPRGADGFK
jgi:hypothetical protein